MKISKRDPDGSYRDGFEEMHSPSIPKFAIHPSKRFSRHQTKEEYLAAAWTELLIAECLEKHQY